VNDQLSRIEAKLDRLMSILGDGKGKLPSEIKREALAKVLQLDARKRKKGHEREAKG
jgi:hypothetical protein